MSFADKYLQKHAIREALIKDDCDPAVQLIVTIPAFRESGLTKSLDSLYICTKASPTEIIVLINSPLEADEETLKINEACYKDALAWVEAHPHDFIDFHIVYEKDLAPKHFGAGLARKLVMDEALRRLSAIDRTSGIILSLDADTLVESNYLEEIESHFLSHPKSDGCSINFEHPTNNSEVDKNYTITNKNRISDDGAPSDQPKYDCESYSDEVYEAIVNYELYQRYFLECLRFAEYRYAYHTVGSAFAVKAQSYASQGGMSKRQAGEDFYFIQKLAILGNYTECNSTTVHPSPRPSNRVPFGTGPEIQRQIDHPGSGIQVHGVEIFFELQYFFSSLHVLYKSGITLFRSDLCHSLKLYLNSCHFNESVEEILNNSSNFRSFLKRFRRKFNQFWIIKYLHFAEDYGHSKIDLLDAVNGYFKFREEKIQFKDSRSALTYFRNLNKKLPDFERLDTKYNVLASTDLPPSM